MLRAPILTALEKPTHWCNNGNIMGVTNDSLIGFKSCSTGWTAYPLPLLSQTPKNRQIIGPLRELTTISLLNAHSLKPTPRFHYTHRWRHLSALIKEASLCNQWWLTMRPKTCQGTENERLQNAQPKWSLYTAPTLLSLRCHCRRGGRKSMKPEAVDYCRESVSSGHTSGQLHIHSHCGCDSMHNVCTSPNQIKL